MQRKFNAKSGLREGGRWVVLVRKRGGNDVLQDEREREKGCRPRALFILSCSNPPGCVQAIRGTRTRTHRGSRVLSAARTETRRTELEGPYASAEWSAIRERVRTL